MTIADLTVRELLVVSMIKGGHHFDPEPCKDIIEKMEVAGVLIKRDGFYFCTTKGRDILETVRKMLFPNSDSGIIKE